jgi:hypothetical protein
MAGGALYADPIPVRRQEGTLHGFLVVRTLDGKIIGHEEQKKAEQRRKAKRF